MKGFLPAAALVGVTLMSGSATADQVIVQSNGQPVKVTALAGNPPATMPADEANAPIQPQAAPAADVPAGPAIRCKDGSTPPELIRALIEKEAARQGGDLKLALAIADQESGFGARQNSDAGARGPMQLMPETARRYAVSDICDPAENIRGGIAFLKDLNATFGGNVMLMVAAYNAGENRVLKSGGVPAIRETVDYTARVTNVYYGFDNVLKGGKRAKKSAAVAAPAPLESTPAAVDATGSVGNAEPLKPINKPKADGDRWIGGSVLYVEEGE